MNFVLVTSLLGLGLFGGMLLLLDVGTRLRRRHLAMTDGEATGFGAAEGAVFGLLGLLIAFTFSGAADRWQERRHLIVEEANAIGTAYLRLDLLPASAQPALRQNFRDYADSRLAAYRKLPDIGAAKAELDRSAGMQLEIWSKAVAASTDRPQAALLLLPALNQMIDITTTRTVVAQMHPPVIIFVLLTALTLACALIAGYGLGGSPSRSWLHTMGFAAILTATVFVTLNLEYPRLGLIRINAADQLLVDVRNSLK